MAKYVFIRDEIKNIRDIGECSGRLVDFIKILPLVNPDIYLNNENIKKDDEFIIDDDYVLEEDDTLLIVNRVGAAAVGITNVVGAFFFNLAASVAVSFALNKLLAPDKPSIPRQAEQRQAETEFTINTSQNQARNGQPIPECFGNFIRIPDLISASYRRYENNDQFLYMLLCVGIGQNTLNNLFIEDTNVTAFVSGDIEYRLYKTSAEHTGNDKIKDDWNTTFTDPYMRDVVITAKEVQDILLEVANPFNEIQLNPSNTLTDYIEFDIILPNGLTNNNSNRSVTFEFQWRDSLGVLTTQQETLTDNTISPIRRTYGYSVSPDYYKTRAIRITADSTSNNIRDDIYLDSMKAYLINNDVTGNGYIDYGDVTLLAVKLRATNAISSRGQLKVKGNFTRDGLTDLKSAMEYVWTADNGGRQPLATLDLPTMSETYNQVIQNRTTVYQTLQSMATSQRYNFFPSSNIMTVKKDVAQPVSTFIFNEANIVRNTLRIKTQSQEATDYDGVRVIYKDATSFEDRFAVYPTNASFPEDQPLDGVTDAAFAAKQAEFLYNQNLKRNVKISFDTELDGHVPSLYEKCSITHPTIANSQSGFINAFTTDTVTINETIKEDYTDLKILFRDRQGKPSVLYDVLDVADRKLTIDVSGTPLPSDLYVGSDELRTVYSLGEGTTYTTEFLFTEMKPKRDNIISVVGWKYDDTIYN